MNTLTAHSCFGPCFENGGIRFRIWAPAAKTVDLVLSAGGEYALTPVEQGFFEVWVAGLGAGTRYYFRIDGGRLVPDPASRYQPDDVDGASEIVDLESYAWRDAQWQGRPWIETVIYELHVGTFTPEGTYRAVIDKLDLLVELGITAIELMPLAEAPGTRNWGYDGVLLYAPERSYGRPEDLQALVDAAHDRGLMVFLDVVYNHFGPQGNYLNLYAPDFFTDRYHTPWGAAIDLSGPEQEPVRRFFCENSLLWLHHYHFDGLRFDAAHELRDHAIPGFLDLLAAAIRDKVGEERHIHLMLENDDNNVRLLSRHGAPALPRYDAQWDDDLHHALHVIVTGESYDYYRDYAEDPVGKLMRAMSEGFCYQGEMSQIRKRRRGAPSAELPAVSFVSFLQNHDQVGNRAFGERLGALARPRALACAVTLILLSPMIPMLFMGEEWNASTPFLYFCDFEPDLAKLVTAGRRNDFAGFPDFAPQDLKKIPDPCAPETFEKSRLKWAERDEPEHRVWLQLYRELLQLRRREIIPRLVGIRGNGGSAERLSDRAFTVRQRLGEGSILTILANLGDAPLPETILPPGKILYAPDNGAQTTVAPWTVRAYLDAEAPAQ